MNIKCLLGSLIVFLVPAKGMSVVPPGTISVMGIGTATSAPDMARFETAVVTHAASAIDAMSQNSESVAKVLQTLQGYQIEANDLQTVRVDVTPKFERKRPQQAAGGNVIVGYLVTNRIRVQVHDLTELGAIIDAVVKAGSNEVTGIHFDIDEKTAQLDRVRADAIQDAHRRAELYAQAAGVQIGKVISIQESGLSQPQPRPLMRTLAAQAVPVAPGKQQLSVSLQVVYEIRY